VNKYFKGMDSGYPTYGTAQKATWRSTFGPDEANFAWNEITVVNGPDDTAKNLNRKVQAMGQGIRDSLDSDSGDNCCMMPCQQQLHRYSAPQQSIPASTLPERKHC
jgi:hypothetical protein